MRHSAIIIGGDHHNTLGVIRALGYKGVKSIVILVTLDDAPYVSYSKYLDKCIILRKKDEIVPCLIELSKSNREKSILFSCADFATSEIDNAFDKLKNYYYLPTAKRQGVCNHYMSKDIMAALAEKVGLRIPKSWVLGSDMQINTNQVSIPCIVKPLSSIKGSKAEIKVIKDGSGICDYLNDKRNHKYLVQEFIDKEFEYQLIGCSLNHGREVIIPGYSKCIRPCPGTNTGFLEYKPLEDFNCDLVACESFIKDIGYQGLFSMEFLRDKQGNDYFMEINMRNDGNGISVTGAGVNLPYIWYLYCSGANYKDEVDKEARDIFVMPEFDDFQCFVKNKKISLIKWLRDMKNTDVFMEYDPSDRKPFFIKLKKLIIKKILAN